MEEADQGEVRGLKARVEELSDIIYGIDFVCRAFVKAEDALRSVQELCDAAKVLAVETGRTMNHASEHQDAGTER